MPIVLKSSSRLVTNSDLPSLLKAGLAGNNRPCVTPSLTPLKSPSLAMALPIGSTTTISSAWLAATQILLSASSTIDIAAVIESQSVEARSVRDSCDSHEDGRCAFRIDVEHRASAEVDHQQ